MDTNFLYIIVVCSVAALIAFFAKPRVIFCAMPLVFFFSDFPIFSETSLAFLYFVITFLILALKFFLAHHAILSSKYILILLAFTSYLLVGSFYRGDIVVSLKTIASLLLFGLFFLNFIRNYKDLEIVLLSFMYIGAFFAVLYITVGPGISNIFSEVYDRGSFLEYELNAIGMHWGAAFLSSLSYGLNTTGSKRRRYMLVSLVTLIALIGTMGRGAILGTSVGFCFFLIASHLYKFKGRRVLIFVLILGVFLGSGNFMSRVKEEPVFEEMSRVIIWQQTINIIKKNMLFGVGSGSAFLSEGVVGRWGQTGRPQYAHNSYFQSTANWGLPAGIFFLLIILVTLFGLLKRLYQIYKTKSYEFDPLSFSITSCFIVYAVTIAFFSREAQKDLFFVIFMCWTLLGFDEREKNQNIAYTTQ